MPFTAPQLTQFFTSGAQMALTASQRASLAAQGLTSVDDFADFGKDELDQAIRNMRTHIPGVSAVAAVPAVRGNNGSAAVAAIPAVPAILPIVMPAKSTHRLLVAAIAYHYYTETSRAVTHTNMHYSNVLKSFYIEWKALASMSSRMIYASGVSLTPKVLRDQSLKVSVHLSGGLDLVMQGIAVEVSSDIDTKAFHSM